MNKTKQPGIICDNIFLKEISFKRSPILYEKFDHNVEFTSASNISEDNKHLIQELTIHINKEVHDSPFELNCTMIGVFSSIDSEENMTLKKFSESHSPAIIMPYLREIVADITLRSGIKPFILRPINVMALIGQASKEPETESK